MVNDKSFGMQSPRLLLETSPSAKTAKGFPIYGTTVEPFRAS